MTEARDIESLVATVRDEVAARSTLEDALAGLARLLGSRFPVSRISVRTYDPRTDDTVIEGVWSVGPTYLGRGIRIPARATSFGDVELRGGSVIERSPSDDDRLLDQLVRDEGNHAWVVIPLVRERLVAGLLSISSHTTDAFADDDLPFFDALGTAIATRLLELASGEGVTPR